MKREDRARLIDEIWVASGSPEVTQQEQAMNAMVFCASTMSTFIAGAVDAQMIHHHEMMIDDLARQIKLDVAHKIGLIERKRDAIRPPEGKNYLIFDGDA